MNKLLKICFICIVLTTLATAKPLGEAGVSISADDNAGLISNIDFNNQATIITDVFATGYYCVYNSELPGPQTVNINISNIPFTLKASFLFGGRGVAMQGTGRTAPDGDYIKYAGGAASFVRLWGPNAGKNLDGRYVINPQTLRERYAALGITDFSGFGNLALLHPDRATFSVVSSITGSAGQPLTPLSSVAVDPALIPLGQSFSISFNNESALSLSTSATFTANDTGGAIKGKHIDIYLGEGQAALDLWTLSGGNRFVKIYLP